MADSGAIVDPDWLDLVYEAAICPERWPDILHRLAAGCGAKGGVLHVHSEHERRWTASPGFQTTFDDYLAAGWPNRSDRVSRGIGLNQPGFLTEADLLTEAEMAVQPVYQDFLVPRGLQANAATHIADAADGELILSLWGFPGHAAARAIVPALDALRPHLVRAAMVAARLQLGRVRSAVETLALIKVPSAILGQRRRMLAANDLFEARLAEFGYDTPSGLRLTQGHANTALEDALARLEGARSGGASLPLQMAAGRPAELHVLPVSGAARDLMTGARALLVLTAPRQKHSLGVALLQSLFNLTRAEARLAQALLDNVTLKNAAKQLRITEGTARTQLKSVFEKTMVHSQSELLLLLSQYHGSGKLG